MSLEKDLKQNVLGEAKAKASETLGDSTAANKVLNNGRNNTDDTAATTAPYYGQESNKESKVDTDKERIVVTQRSGLGNFASAVTLAYFGHNHRGMGNPIQNNTDNYGMTFFTRPRLNLSYDNIVKDRVFSVLETGKEASVQRAIRAWLDPVGSKLGLKGGFHCPLVDDLNPFITLLDNNLLSLTGWPDPYVETFTSDEGVYKERWSMIDGPAKFHDVYSLNATFRNIVDDPISMIFNIWTQYAARAYEGVFIPYPDAIFENMIDYNTRIYRLVLDHSRTRVQKIAACGASFPIANNLGASFNFNSEKPYNDEIDQISVAFQCMGAIYNDPILIYAFNSTVIMYNPEMGKITTDSKGNRVCDRYVKISPEEKLLFNYYGYPWINPDTMELEWWVNKDDYNLVLGKGTSKATPTSTIQNTANSAITAVTDAIGSKLR